MNAPIKFFGGSKNGEVWERPVPFARELVVPIARKIDWFENGDATEPIPQEFEYYRLWVIQGGKFDGVFFYLCDGFEPPQYYCGPGLTPFSSVLPAKSP